MIESGEPGKSVLVDSRVSNTPEEAFEDWGAALAAIRPTEVQIYSTDYPMPEAGVDRVLPYVLKRFAGEVEGCMGLQVCAYWFQGREQGTSCQLAVSVKGLVGPPAYRLMEET